MVFNRTQAFTPSDRARLDLVVPLAPTCVVLVVELIAPARDLGELELVGRVGVDTQGAEDALGVFSVGVVEVVFAHKAGQVLGAQVGGGGVDRTPPAVLDPRRGEGGACSAAVREGVGDEAALYDGEDGGGSHVGHFVEVLE